MIALKTLKEFGILGGLAGLLCCAGCASLGTYNPATERKEFIIISTPEEVAMGRTIHQEIGQQNTLVEDSEEAGRLERIGQRLAQVSDRQDYRYHFHLVENDELNAFTTPGGHVYVYTGLLKKLTTDDQLAFVLAHEIGHCAARHTVKKFQAALGYNFIGSLVLGAIESQMAQQLAVMSSDAVMGIVFSSYSRKDEHEADRLGVKYLYLAGYDLNGAQQALAALEESSKGVQIPLILRSHPFLKDRIKTVGEDIENIKKRYDDS